MSREGRENTQDDHGQESRHPYSITAHLEMSGYVKYLIRRHQKFQHGDNEKIDRGKYVIIYNAISRRIRTVLPESVSGVPWLLHEAYQENSDDAQAEVEPRAS